MQPDYGLSIYTAATTTPITIDEALAQLRVDSTEGFPYIRGLVRKAVRFIEETEDRTLVNTGRQMSLDEFPCGASLIKIPRSPVQAITSIVYINSTGGNTTMPSSDYLVQTNRMPGRIAPIYGGSWPTAREQIGSVTITYQAGYGGSTASSTQSVEAVPETDKHVIALLVAHWFENREPVNIGNIVNAIPHTVATLLAAESPGRYP